MARKEVIYLTINEEFGQLVRDICGSDSLASSSQKTRLSGTYINSMRKGLVPTATTIDQFATGYKVSGEVRKRLHDLAGNARNDVNPERLIIAACDAAGFDTMQRLAVLEVFRDQSARHDSNSNAA